MHRTAPPGHSVGVGATGRSESEGRAADAASAFWPPSAQGTGGRTGGTRRGLGGACQHSPSHSISRWSSPCSAGLARGPPAGVRERPASHTPCMLHACRMHVARCFVFCSRTRMARARSAACDGWAHDGYGPQAAGRMPRKRSECDGREPFGCAWRAVAGFACAMRLPAGAARACAARSA